MKSLSVKIPVNKAQEMDDNGHFNPSWLTGFLVLNASKKPPQNALRGLCINYTFKVDNDLHKMVKLQAIENDLPINEFVGRLLEKYYG